MLDTAQKIQETEEREPLFEPGDTLYGYGEYPVLRVMQVRTAPYDTDEVYLLAQLIHGLELNSMYVVKDYVIWNESKLVRMGYRKQVFGKGLGYNDALSQ